MANAVGTGTITVTVMDNGGTASGGVPIFSRSFTVTIVPVNQPPTIDPIQPNNVVVAENSPSHIVNLTGITQGAGDSGQNLSFLVTSSNEALIDDQVDITVTYNPPSQNATLSFTPEPNQTGLTTITVQVMDDNGNSNNDTSVARTFTVWVCAEQPGSHPHAPSGNLAYTQGQTAQPIAPLLTVTSTTPDIVGATVQIVNNYVRGEDVLGFTDPTGGNIQSSFDPVTGTLTLTPTAGSDIDPATFTTVLRAVTYANTAAQATIGAVTPNNGSISIAVANGGSGYATPPAVILSGGTFTSAATATANLTNGVVTSITVNGGMGYSALPTVTIAPPIPSSATRSVIFSVDDGASDNNINSTFRTITVAPVNHAPTLQAISNVTVLENSTPTTVVLTGISDGDNNSQVPLTITTTTTNISVTNPAVPLISKIVTTYDGTQSVNTTGFLTFTTQPNDSGTATITVTVRDSGGANGVSTVSQVFTVTVMPVNQAPTLATITNPAAVQENSTSLPIARPPITLTGITDGDNDNSVQSLTITAAITSGTQGLISNPVITFAPLAGITVNPGGGGSGYSTANPPAVTISGGNGTGATAVALVNNGAVTGILLTSPVTSIAVNFCGSGYSSASPPAVTFNGGGGGTAAMATAVVNSAGVVTGIMITNAGTGYTSAPSVVIAPPAVGTQATATAAISTGGSGYTTVPTITIAPPNSGTTATATGVLRPIAPRPRSTTRCCPTSAARPSSP